MYIYFILISILSLLLLVVLLYLFGRWEFRKIVIKKLASTMGLSYAEKSKNFFSISGNYKSKNVTVTEWETIMESPNWAVSVKVLKIDIEGRIIYSREGEVILPTTKKIKKIIDNYIDKGITPKKYTLLKWLMVIFLFILFGIAQFIMRTNN